MNPKRIAVIGAGLGGLSVAARLASDGHRVEIFESQSFPGGKAGNAQIGAYRFDTGPSLVTMPDVFDQLFEETGERREEYIKFDSLDEICRYYFADGSRLTSFSNPDKFAAEVAEKTSDTRDSLLGFLDHSAKIFRITADLFLKKSLHEIRPYTNLRVLGSLLSMGKIDAFRTMDRSVRSYFTDERMVQLFDRYATYNGSNPYRTPGTLNVIPHVEYGMIGAVAGEGHGDVRCQTPNSMSRAVAARDGVFAISRGMAKLAVDKGAKQHLSTRVSGIRYDQHTRRITGITVNDTDAANKNQSSATVHKSDIDNSLDLDPDPDLDFDFDVVISNADVYHTYHSLLDDDKAPLLRRHVRLEPSSSGMVFLWGMREKFDELGLHNIFFSSEYHAEFSDIFDKKKCPDDPTVYVNITSKINPGDAPAGGENWFVLVNAPSMSGQDWAAETARTREAVVKRLSKILGRNIESSIVVESILTPPDIERSTGSRFGSLYGISSNTKRAAFMRHPNRSRRYPGLFFCGGSAHPGGGMPLVVLSGKITADLVRREFARGRL